MQGATYRTQCRDHSGGIHEELSDVRLMRWETLAGSAPLGGTMKGWKTRGKDEGGVGGWEDGWMRTIGSEDKEVDNSDRAQF